MATHIVLSSLAGVMGLLCGLQVISVSTRYRVYGRQHIVCVVRLFSSYRNLVGNSTPVLNRRDG